MLRMFHLSMLTLLCAFTFSLHAQEEARLLRFPTVSETHIVFTYGGDLYYVARAGGVARKITNDEGFEMFAKFSPDGRLVAFTGQYDGNTEVYLIPAEGGNPKRLTYTATLGRDDISDRMGPNNIVMGWTPDGKHVLFRSRMYSFNPFKGQLFKVSVDGGMPEELPFATAGFASYSPDGKKIAFNKVFREFRTWKYYKGGMADEVRIFDFETKEMRKITDNTAQDMQPMWHGNTVYFLSDRDRTMNIFAHDLNTGQTRKMTNHTDYDVKFPSLGAGAIAYEQAGYIHLLDLASGRSSKVSIRIHDDRLNARNRLVDASKFVNGFEVSPGGERVLFNARGDVWTVPAENGITRNLTQSSGSHERNATWSPDGRWIAYLSDASGEDEIYIVDPKREKEPAKLTSGADTYKYDLEWSPDSKKLLWGDKKNRLQFVDIDSRQVTQVATGESWEIRNYTWSPDSRWVAFTMPEWRTTSRIWLYSTASKELAPVTDPWYNSANPHFSHDGKYLFFVSSRDFNPIYSWTEWNHAYNDMTRIYFTTLQKDTPSPFAYKNNEVEPAKQEETPKDDSKKGKDNAPAKASTPEVKIDLDGIGNRVAALPTEAGNYGISGYVDGRLYYRFTRTNDKPAYKVYDLEKQEEKKIGEFQAFQITRDRKKVLVRQGGDKYAVLDLPKGELKVEKTMDLSGMKVQVDLNAEWTQIYNESWRQMRDFFYAPNMHGVDWPAMRDKYAPLVAHAGHRADVNYLVGELIGELNVGHAYVGGGDVPKPDRLKLGLLGARLERDASGYWRIANILQGENWRKDARSPLTEVGVNVNEGEYIIAINGQDLRDHDNPYTAMMGQAGREVELRVNSRPDASGSRTVIVKPTDDEAELYYFNWVRDNIAKVDKATNGRVGYIHIPDMGQPGLNEFVKHFYPQLRKEALIIDVRGNGGGNVSPMIIERLRREIAMVDLARNGKPNTDPGDMMPGPLVALLDQWSASDGDLFPYRFKHYKLGKLIGHRSWGGVVGIRGSLPFIDGGSLMRPEFASYDTEGKEWIIEGYGVDPDIVVDNDVHKEYMGEDQQLNRAIQEILEDLKTRGYKLPETPPYPDKSK